MANWNMSVQLNAHGNGLARSLRESAQHARSLERAAHAARTEVRQLGTAADTAARHIRTLGREARTAARHVHTLGSDTRTAAVQIGRYGSAARDADRHLAALGAHSRTAARDLARMRGDMQAAVRDLTRMSTAAQRAATHMGRVGDRSAARALRSYGDNAGYARQKVAGLVSLLSGGGLLLGGAEIVKEGNELTQSMNTFGAVTGATAMQMQRASATANQLGNDLSLPGATAGDAAEAMVELAKAGFRTDQAIDASRSSLVLASAAQVSAADSAKYLGDMMDQFGMGADQASVAADTLAATANAASGDIIDIYYAMKYAGPVAHGLGVTMQEAATAVGMLGKAGILGQTAGTTLRGMMANLAAPTPQMIEGLKAMGIQAWDARGNFKGLRNVIDGLSKAQHRMTQQDFAAAVKKSMGKPAMSGAIALAHQGTESFDALMSAVSDTGAAAGIAAAKGKGLAGAMLQLKTQSKQTGLAFYQGMSPGLEFITRGLTRGMSDATPKIEHFFKYLNDSAVLFGPDIAKKAREMFSGIGDEARDMVGPLKELGGNALATFLHLLLTAGKTAVTVIENLAHGIEPVVEAFGHLTDGSSGAASTLDIAATAIDGAASAVEALSGVLVPIGHLVAGLVDAFGGLPGPVQQFVLAALLARRLTPIFGGLASTVSGRVTGAFRGLSGEMAVQRSLATSAGVSLSRYGAAFAVLETRVPVIGRMAASFRTASTAGSGFTGTLRGITSAAGTGLRGAMGGLMSAMGGPWGVALAGATVALGMLASAQQKAAAATAEHQADIGNLTQALRESNGIVNESVRQQAAQAIQNRKLEGSNKSLMDVLRQAGVTLPEVTDAYLDQGKSVNKLADHMEDLARQEAKRSLTSGGDKKGSAEAFAKSQAYQAAAEALRGMSGDAKTAARNAKELDDAMLDSNGAVTAYSKLKDAVGALADKTGDADSRTRALREALDLLSGGSVSLQAAQARVNEAITNANEALADGVDHADGWGKALIKANGSLNTTSKNGQQLFGTINSIADASSSAAISAYDFAQSQGKDVPQSIAAAKAEMKKGRQAVIDLAGSYGLNATQAGKVADAMGLIPGKVATLLTTEGVDTTLADLLAVQAAYHQTPGKKTIKVDSLTSEAKQKLEDFGYTIKLIPGTREYKITAPTGKPIHDIDLLLSRVGLLGDKNVHINIVTSYTTLGTPSGGTSGKLGRSVMANGGVLDFYADGGTTGRENHVAQFARGGAWRVWAEDETGGEAYIPLAPSKRNRSRQIAEETVKRLGGKSVQWNADGSVTDWRYDPSTGSLYSTSDAGSAAHKTRKVKVKAKGKGKATTKDVEYFDEAALEKKLKSSSAATRKWNADLTKVADRAGSDVAEALAAMGEDGIRLTHKMATGSKKYLDQMAASLRGLAATAKASLTDYTRQLTKANTSSSAFQTNLTKLAASGYGDLAAQLAAQGDEAAQQLASAAVKDKGKAKSANSAASKANKSLTTDQLAELIQIIGAITSSKTGLHTVADTTGLAEDEIVAVANKASAQIKSSLGSRSTRFLSDLGKANKGLAYASGGIREGVYATTGGAVTFAEPSTGGEAYIPLGPGRRRGATNVLSDVAGRFGLGLTDAGASKVVVIREQGPLIGSVTIPVTKTNANAYDIASQVGRQVRRAQRGGVSARG